MKFGIECLNGHPQEDITVTEVNEITARAKAIREHILGKTCSVENCRANLKFKFGANPYPVEPTTPNTR